MPRDLVPSDLLIRQTLTIEAAYTVSRMQVLQSLPGNPAGIVIRKVGESGFALMARYFRTPHFNKVVGLRASQAADLVALVDWYRENDATPRFEILPRADDGVLCDELIRLGFSVSGFHTALVRDLAPMPQPSRAADVELVTTSESLEEFLDVHAAGWSIPDPAGFKRNVRSWLGRPGWSLFLARDKGRPAATAILYIEGTSAYLADAACHPDYRRRGFHLALLERRIYAAALAGANFICSGADFLSASHRNMERAGMQIQFNRSIWTERRGS